MLGFNIGWFGNKNEMEKFLSKHTLDDLKKEKITYEYKYKHTAEQCKEKERTRDDLLDKIAEAKFEGDKSFLVMKVKGIDLESKRLRKELVNLQKEIQVIDGLIIAKEDSIRPKQSKIIGGMTDISTEAVHDYLSTKAVEDELREAAISQAGSALISQVKDYESVEDEATMNILEEARKRQEAKENGHVVENNLSIDDLERKLLKQERS